MNRLPSCDRTTQRLELAGFLSLGLAGITMVALAAAQMTEFMAGSDRPNVALSGRTEPLSVSPRADVNRAGATNVNGTAAARATAHDTPNNPLRSASKSGLVLLLR